ncbi:hypothetical protein P7C73_g3022, partial [Tremellales sp. Uapishka_1]
MRILHSGSNDLDPTIPYDKGQNDRPSVGGWLGLGAARPTILVTGGAGSLGQSLLPSLLSRYTVHVLDVAPAPSSLPKSSNLIYHHTSILSPTAANLFAGTSFDGIINLAAISLEEWCHPRQHDCLSVNRGGLSAILKSIETTPSRKRWAKSAKTPWIIQASTMDVFGPGEEGILGGILIDELTARSNPIGSLGETKLAAEQELEFFAARHPLRGAILRFAEVYGYDQSISIPEAFIPSLLTNSLTALPIQYSSSSRALDLLHVADAVSGVMKAIAYLETRQEPLLQSFNLVQGGRRWTSKEVVDLVRSETASLSPLRDIGSGRVHSKDPDFSRVKAESVLGWEPTVSLHTGIKRSLSALSEAIAAYSRTYLSEHCKPTPEFPAVNGQFHAAEEDLRNKDLWKLSDCLVNVGFDHLGFVHHLKCEDGKHCRPDGEKVVAMNWNASTFFIRRVEGGKKKDRTVRVRFEEENGMGWLGYKTGTVEGEVGLELFDPEEKGWTGVFDMEVAGDTSNLRLMIPNSNTQLQSIANVTDNSDWFSFEKVEAAPTFDMRMTVLCCPSQGDWPLLLDDFETADMRFGTTGEIPFNSSRRSHLCSRAEQAVRFNDARLSASRQAAGAESASTEAQAPMIFSTKPHNWAMKDLETCWNDCASPTICVQTGNCRCVKSDDCSPRRGNPLLALQSSGGSGHFESVLGSLGHSAVLVERVESMDWRDVLLPEAREYLIEHPEFIKVHVADGYEGQEAVEAAECHNLQPTHCFSADSVLYKAMRHISVPADEAELIVLPIYQQCTGLEFMLHDLMYYAGETIPGVREGEKRVGVVMTHDWGICISFAWEIWSAREKHTLYPDSILDNVLVWSVMGDYDSPCYRPHQDVVIPARTCRSLTLRETFPTVEHIRPVAERTHLVTWSGTYWGTGKSTRLRLTCDRGGAGEKELVKGKGPQSSWYSWDYMKELSNARFCPQPSGIAGMFLLASHLSETIHSRSLSVSPGWSPRVNDAIYAGCIPVFIAEGTHYPFASFLDWSKLSVRIRPTDLDHLEEILAAIPIAQIEALQANIVVIREAFMYATDENPQEELERQGPMFFALHEAGMRMKETYPTTVVG